MCEFDILLDGEKIFEEAVYLKRDGTVLLARDILGNEKSIEDVRIEEIDVSSERLILSGK